MIDDTGPNGPVGVYKRICLMFICTVIGVRPRFVKAVVLLPVIRKGQLISGVWTTVHKLCDFVEKKYIKSLGLAI